MPQSKSTSRSIKLMRRSFLFLSGIAAVKYGAEFYSIAQNRSNFLVALKQFIQEIRYLTAKSSPSATPQALPTVIVPSSATPQPLPSAPVVSPSPTPLPNNPSPTLVKASPRPIPPAFSPQKGSPVIVNLKTLLGVNFYHTVIDLTDPEIFISIGLANNADRANSAVSSSGDEPFEKLVARHRAAVVANGTFFSKDAQKRVMGNLVAGGKFLKYSRWENFGTTLGLKAGNQPEMVTARTERKPEWNQHWFSLTCGPRLLKGGKIWLSPKSEGFSDPHVLDVGVRTAIGFSAQGKQLHLFTFLASLSLQQEAQIVKAVGCVEAMNLDGGASTALAHQGEIIVPAGRPLTNVILVYDTNYPAPTALKTSWLEFQQGIRPELPS